MPLRVYDTMQRSVVPFEPRDAGRVAMYVCGPTVYNYIHIGNARTFLWFDQIRRYLRYRGYDVTYVMNYTDVDDKIIERANVERVPTETITAKYSRAFEDAMGALNVPPADIICRATQHLDEMIKAIEGLIEKGVAYEVDGNVFYSVEDFKGYGKLSGRSLDDLRAGEGERIEPHESKRSPLDFALWKAAKEGEPSWSSPWGEGRPGWHIECSVMSTQYLGMGFDIHGGGSDLTFPHHENEIAQAEALEGTEPFVRHWLHSGMVQMESTKMSKSLGNVVLVNEVVERYRPEAVRYWAITGSYRAQLMFSDDALDDARQALERWKTFFVSASHALGDRMPAKPDATVRPVDSDDQPEGYVQRFIEVMDEDFNSAEALAVVHELVREANKLIEGVQLGEEQASEDLVAMVKLFLELTHVLGFTFTDDQVSGELVAGLVEYLLELREDAREEKAFERADAIRDRLVDIGVAVEDTPAGPRWRIGAG